MNYKNIIKDLKAKKDILYLLEKFNNKSGLFLMNNKFVFVEENINTYNLDGIETEFLTLKTSVNIESIENDPTFKKGNYNLIIFKSEEENNEMNNFIKLCKLYSQNKSYTFKDFFLSLYNIFQSKKADKNKNLIGLWGELYVIFYFKTNLNMEISNFWHLNTNDKYDFILPKCSMEIKTTTTTDCLITIKHDQIFNDQNKVLAAVHCQSNNSGYSILDLIKLINKDKTVSQNIKFQLKLQQEIMKIDVEELETKKIRIVDIKFLETNKIPTLQNIPENITNLVYQYSCENLVGLTNKKLLNIVL